MGGLVGFVEDDALGILQVQDASLGRRLFGCDQIFEKLSQLAMVGHIAAKDEPAIFMDDEESVGPGAVAAVDFTVEAVNDNGKSHILQSLQVTRMSQFLLP
jgi:hypothetical protein